MRRCSRFSTHRQSHHCQPSHQSINSQIQLQIISPNVELVEVLQNFKMKPNLWFNLPFDAILLLSLASGSVAHGSHKVMNMSLSHADSMNAKPETYFQTVDWNGWMIAHISVMTLSWVFILPVGTFSFSLFHS